MNRPVRPAVGSSYEFCVFLIVLLACVLYLPALHGPFVMDDVPNIHQNPLVRGPSVPAYDDEDRVPDLPAVVLWRSRYVGYLAFHLNHRLHGLDPAGYRVFNNVIHACNGLLVLALVLLLFSTQRLRGSPLARWRTHLALCAALLFVVHPVQTQAVSYIVQRFASLATLFFLLSTVLFLRAQQDDDNHRFRRAASLGLSLLAAALAMKTKEIAITLPVIVLLLQWQFVAVSRMRAVGRALPFATVALLVPAAFVFGRWAGHDSGSVSGSTLSRAEYLLTEARVVATYLRLLAWPADLRLDYDFPESHALTDAGVLPCLALHAALVVLAIALWLRAREPALRLVSFGIAWFYVTLSVESGLIPIRDVIWEHRVYLPSVGAFIAASAAGAWGIDRLHRAQFRRLAVLGVAVAILALSVATWQRNTLWGSGIALAEDTLRKSPGKGRAHALLGDAYLEQSDFVSAARAYGRAMELDPSLDRARFNLGRCFAELGMWADAEAQYRAVVHKRPDLVFVHAEWATALWMTGHPDQALREYRIAERWDPANALQRVNAGTLLLSMGRPDLALAELEEARRLQPADPVVERHWRKMRATVESGGLVGPPRP